MSREVGRQYLTAVKSMWDTVDKLWDPPRLLTQLGYQFCQTWAVRAAHHEFPYALNMLSLMCPLTSGARVSIFPTSPSPLVAFTINVNYSQTRKSSVTSFADSITRELDKVVQHRVSKAVQRQVEAEQQLREPHHQGQVMSRRGRFCILLFFWRRMSRVHERFSLSKLLAPVTRFQFFRDLPCMCFRPKAAVLSAAIASATPEEWFHRCASDFKQVKNSAALPGEPGQWQGRQWFGVLGNLDETYDFLTAFGLLSEEGGKASKVNAKVNPHQSALNKLMQFGSAARATKTSGSYGDSSGNGISLGVVGNMHPATYVPMERSETGSHHAATKERFFICTGRPIQPHEDLPEDYPLPGGGASSSRFLFSPRIQINPGCPKMPHYYTMLSLPFLSQELLLICGCH